MQGTVLNTEQGYSTEQGRLSSCLHEMFRETGNKQISREVYNVIGGDKSIEEKLRVKD